MLSSGQYVVTIPMAATNAALPNGIHALVTTGNTGTTNPTNILGGAAPNTPAVALVTGNAGNGPAYVTATNGSINFSYPILSPHGRSVSGRQPVRPAETPLCSM